MSGLMRNVIDQVLRGMGEEERARSVEYVTDQMIEKMDSAERATLLLAIVDRVLGNLTLEERNAFTAKLASQLTQSPVEPGGAVPDVAIERDRDAGPAPVLDARS